MMANTASTTTAEGPSYVVPSVIPTSPGPSAQLAPEVFYSQTPTRLRPPLYYPPPTPVTPSNGLASTMYIAPTPSPSLSQYQIIHSSPLALPKLPHDVVPNQSQPSRTSREHLAIVFAQHLFDGVLPEIPSTGRRRGMFQWPIENVTTEDRLLVVLRAMRQAGFETVGGLLVAMFEKCYTIRPEV